MDPLYISSKIEVRNSPIHGRGVFAKEFIPAQTLIEECHFMKLRKKWNELEPILQDYVFFCPDDHALVILLGFGGIYNHSINNNALWGTDMKRNIFMFFTIKDIYPNEEIWINYGENYENHFKNKSIIKT